jgi:16S rRNA (cytidine1402-2'-O)-methyltransferase
VEEARAPRRAPVRPGCLHVVSTPIGNLEDITHRAVRVLGEVEVIAAEDTRSARVLLARYGIRTRAVSLHRDNEAARSEEIVARLRAGASVALVSEAGTPGVSDPGGRLVARALAEGLAVEAIPGPSAVTTALVLSGLRLEGGFTFVGFLPRRGRERREALAEIAASPRPTVFFEAPGRLAATLAELTAAVAKPGERRAAVLREMTKLHEEATRGSLAELSARVSSAPPPRGEVTVVLDGAPRPSRAGAASAEPGADGDGGDLVAEVDRRLAAGETPRAIALALAERGVPRRVAYQLALGRAAREGGQDT